jgi:hypothetical protein
MMKSNQLCIRIEDELKQQIVMLAKQEHRKIADQASYLIEQGLRAMRRQYGLSADGYAGNHGDSPAQSGAAAQ